MRTIFLNTFALTLGQAIAQLANLVFVVYFTRTFGADTYGHYSVALAISALLSVCVSCGTNALAIKQISRKPDAERRLIGTLIPMQGFAGLLVISGVLLIGAVIPMNSTAYGMLLILAVYNVCAKWSGLIATRYQARELMAYVAGADAIRNVLRLLFGVAFIWVFNDPLAAIGLFPLCALMVFAWLLITSNRQFGSPRLSINPARAGATIVMAWPYFSIAILTVLYDRVGIILLSVIQSETAVGLFVSAERLVMAAGVVQTMFVGAIFPAMSRLAAHQQSAMSILAPRCLRLLLLFTLPTATLIYVFRADIIHLLYGTDFNQSVPVLQVVCWALVLRGINAYLAMLAIAADKHTRLSTLKLAKLIVFVVLAIALIDRLSTVGLAYAILFSEALMITALYLLLRRTTLSLPLFATLARIGVACIPMIIAATALSAQSFPTRIVLLPAALLIGVVTTGAIKLHDLNFLHKIAFGGR